MTERKNFVIQEIIASEEKYSRRLGICVKCFMFPLTQGSGSFSLRITEFCLFMDSVVEILIFFLVIRFFYSRFRRIKIVIFRNECNLENK